MGYASWTDTVTIEGTVNTGSVDLVVVDYSGTWVWKVFDGEKPPVDEIYIFHGFVDDKPTDAELAIQFPDSTIELISYAVATQTLDADGKVVDDAVTVIFDNLFPCITFEADILFHYVGGIPAKISNTIINFGADDDLELRALWYSEEARIDWYWSDETGRRGEQIPDNPIGIQLHNCDYILAVGYIHLPQESELMNKQSSFTATFDVIQWNKY